MLALGRAVGQSLMISPVVDGVPVTTLSIEILLTGVNTNSNRVNLEILFHGTIPPILFTGMQPGSQNRICIGDDIEIGVHDIRSGQKARLYVTAPKELVIWRKEAPPLLPGIANQPKESASPGV